MAVKSHIQRVAKEDEKCMFDVFCNWTISQGCNRSYAKSFSIMCSSFFFPYGNVLQFLNPYSDYRRGNNYYKDLFGWSAEQK